MLGNAQKLIQTIKNTSTFESIMPLLQQPRSSLSDLPVEVICLIIKSCQDFRQVGDLLSVAPTFLRARSTQPQLITRTMLARLDQDYSLAQELAELQLLYPFSGRSSEPPHIPISTPHSIENRVGLFGLIGRNAAAVLEECNYYSLDSTPNSSILWPPPRHEMHPFLPSERRRFSDTYYKAWTFMVAMRGVRTSLDMPLTDWQKRWIQTTSPRELLPICQMLMLMKLKVDRNSIVPKVRLHGPRSRGMTQSLFYYAATLLPSYYTFKATFRLLNVTRQ